jgi:phage shock protein PspC (stress-responsive transcriptional regulator)
MALPTTPSEADMTTHDETPRDDEREPEEEVPTQPLGEHQPRRLYRSRDDRVLGGVCGGIARYFDIDPVIVRVVAVALTFFGGAGVLLYLAALLLVPDERGHVAADASSFRGKVLIAVAGVLLFIAITAAVPWGWGDWFLPGVVFPVAFLALLGLGAWWLVQNSSERERGDPAGLLRAALFGLLLLSGCAVLAVGSAWASAVGGDEAVAGLVIVAGAMLVVGAFVGRVRWLILPALAVALPLAVVSAAGIEVDNSIGERDYRPATAADVRDRYELGMGSLVVDLRETDLAPGDQHLDLKVGVGEAVLLVPRGVCVASSADVGLGVANVFGQDNGGVDVSWDDRRDAPPRTPRVVVNADVGIGAFEVDHERPDHGDGWRFHEDRNPDDRNRCRGDRA